MDPSFVFDLGDDAPPARPAQSPWDFGNAAKLVDEEHSQHRTTSIDHKIREQLRRRTIVRGSGFKDSGGRAKEESEEEDQIEEESDEEEEEEEAGVSEANGNGLQGNGNDGVAGGSEQAESSDDEDSSDENDELEEKWEQKARARSHAEATSSKPAVADKQVRGKNGRAETNEGGPSSKGTFFSSSESASFTARSFGELNISRPLLKACQALGYEKPTPIQSACVPLALTGRDICGSAITGSGKTAAFALPILERLLYRPRRVPATRVLVLTPTRELAVQVHSMIEKLAQFTDIRACLVVGGLSNKVQETALRSHPDVVVATPGRIIDHVRNTQSVGLEDLAILVLDEADRLLEMGFVDEVKEIVRNCPKKRQTLLFSATMTDEVNQLITMSLRNPVRLSADPKTRRPGTLVEEVVKLKPSQEADKEALLLALCTRNFRSKTIIFSATKSEAHRLKILFGLAGMRAAELHGNLTQAMRLQALETFRQQEADYLICTDVAARGLDIMGVETVVNFDCPKDITKYVHRVGRTARAGQNGCAVTFATEKDRALLKAVVKQAGRSLRSRQVAAAAVAKCRDQIERLEEDIREVMQEEQEERALRKAEMEVNKASNMVEHEAEIYSRPPKTWFQSPKDRKQAAETAKKAAEGGTGGEKQVESALSAKDRRALEKKKAEKEKRLPRKKRRRLEAERQIANDQAEMDGQVDEPKRKRSKQDDDTPKTSMVDVGYRKAKGAKSIMKMKEAGLLDPRKIAAMKGVKGKKVKKKVRPEGQEGGQESGAGSGGPSPAGGLKKKEHTKPRKAFKSKKRYKRK